MIRVLWVLGGSTQNVGETHYPICFVKGVIDVLLNEVRTECVS